MVKYMYHVIMYLLNTIKLSLLMSAFVWCMGVQTRFGRLINHKSRDGLRELTDQEKYILEKLQFLEQHIDRTEACKSKHS